MQDTAQFLDEWAAAEQAGDAATQATLTMAASDGRWRLARVHMSFIAGTAGAPIPGISAGRPGAHGGAA